MSDMHIECPKCKERFSVDASLMGETMECGSCETLFELEPSHKVVSAASVPRHKSKANVASFTKSTPSIEKDEVESLRAKAYHQQVDVTHVMPLSPVRILAIIVGCALPALIYLWFSLSAEADGMLSEVSTTNRWILSGFTALVAFVLLPYGFFKKRIVGVLLSVVLAGAVLSLPMQFPYEGVEVVIEEESGDSVDELASEVRYKQELGYRSVESKLAMAKEPSQVVALALIGAKPVHIETIKSYLAQVSGSDEHPNVYKERRIDGEKTVLFVYEEMPISIENVSSAAERFALKVELKKQLQVVEVVVDEERLRVPDVKVLNDPEHIGFYRENLYELQGIDPMRQHEAVLRLARCESFLLRADIEKALLDLLAQENYTQKVALVSALTRCAEDGGAAAAAVKELAMQYIEQGAEVPQEILDFMVERKIEDCEGILLYAWKLDPVVQEQTLVTAGKRGETALLNKWQNLTPREQIQAMHVLKKVGGEKSVKVLSSHLKQSTGELEKSLKATIDEIESRR